MGRRGGLRQKAATRKQKAEGRKRQAEGRSFIREHQATIKDLFLLGKLPAHGGGQFPKRRHIVM